MGCGPRLPVRMPLPPRPVRRVAARDADLEAVRLRTSAAVALLAALILLTALASVTAWVIERDRAADRRGRLADRVAQRAEDFTTRILLGVEGTQGLYAASDEVSREEFARYAAIVLRNAGLTRLDYVERVPPSRRNAWERANSIALPEGAGGDAYVIAHQAPDSATDRMLGIDLAPSPERRRALIQARDTGLPVATAPVELLRSRAWGFAVYAPVYAGGTTPGTLERRRAAFLGLVAGVQRADDLLDHLMSEAGAGVRIAITDDGVPLATSGDPGGDAQLRDVHVPGRVWTVAVGGGPAPSPLIPAVVALIGLLVSGLTAILLISGGRRERYAQELVRARMLERDRAEAALTESEQRHRLMLQTSADPIITIDADGVIRSANAVVHTVLCWEPEALIGRNVAVLMPESERARHHEHVTARAAGAPATVIGRAREIRALRGDGVEIPVVIALSEAVIGGEALYTGIIHDMTEQRAAEHAIRDSEREQAALLSIATAVAANEPERVVFDRIAAAAADITGGRIGVIIGGSEPGDVVLGAWAAPGVPAPVVGERVMTIDDRPDCISAPIHVERRPWGRIVVCIEGRDVAPDAGVRLDRFAAITALAVNSEEARRSLAHLAATDPLTGLWNKRTFNTRLEQELGQAARGGHALSLVVLDIDNFKDVNDTHGHEVGDAVLSEVARRLQATVRDGEVLARVGGEEFAWILPRTDGIHGFQAAERARGGIAAEPFPVVGRLTVSAGVCDLAEAGDALELFRNADAALYWAKRSGRDRCFRYTHEAMDVLAVDERDVAAD